MARRRNRRTRIVVANAANVPRRRRRGRAMVPVQTTVTERALVPVAPTMQVLSVPARNRTRRSRRVRGVANNPMRALTEPGLAFLKCAFAPPDFAVDPGRGIPDYFEGRTNVIKDNMTTAISFTPDTDTYILVVPIPGVAYCKSEVAIGATPTTFTPVFYPTATANFGLDIADLQFTRFRYASQAAGLYSTSNYTTFAGALSVWKPDIRLADQEINAVVSVAPTVVDEVTSLRITGLESIVPLVPRESYTGSFQDGAFSLATTNEGSFEWSDFHFSLEYSNKSFNAPVTATTRRINTGGGPPTLTGLGHIESIVFKVTTPTGATNSCAFRTWNCIECVPIMSSNLFQFAHLSPSPDALAIALYNKLKSRIPVAVLARENGAMWERISAMMMSIFKAGSYVPGPIGLMSGGLGAATDALRMMTI